MKTKRRPWNPFLLLLVPGLLIIQLLASSFGQMLYSTVQPYGVRPAILHVRQIYNSQIGIREKGMNSGAEVEKYLRYVNLAKGNPWCAAFVCWVYTQAGVPNPRTGWSPALFPTSKVIWSKGKLVQKLPQTKSGEKEIARFGPQTADIFGIYFADKKRIAHTGFIDEWNGDWLITVEGNTNASGSREGDGVYRKRRPVSSIYQVARYIDSN